MRRESSGPILTTIFVDYDNIYLSLRRKSEEAAKRFAKDAGLWLRELETGRLITSTNGIAPTNARRIVMNRCYGNPVPRRNSGDNSTDMNSFPFVRHHFLRSGFEVIDCPPLTAQLKNSSDIRMVMDVRDLLGHDTYFDEFIILSGDADFTPVLHRLRAHARRTVIFANDHTAQPYTSISDGEVREADLISLLLEGRSASEAEPNNLAASAEPERLAPPQQIEQLRRELVGEVAALVRQAGQPVPLEALADRLVRTLGHDRTVGTAWAGAGSFRDLLARSLPAELRLSSEPPYYVFEAVLKAPAVEPTAIAPTAVTPAAAVLNRLEIAPAQPLMPQRTAAPLQSPSPLQNQAAVAEPVAPAPSPSVRYGFADPRFDTPAAPVPQQAQLSAPPVASPHVAAPSVRMQPASPHQPAARQAVSAQGLNQAAAQPPMQSTPLTPVQPAAPSHVQYHQIVVQPVASQTVARQPSPAAQAPHAQAPQTQAPHTQAAQVQAAQAVQPLAATAAPVQSAQRPSDSANAIQQSIARIHEACQAPPLSPPEYRALFDAMAQEINANGLTGAQTLVNIVARAQEQGIDVRRDDVRFVIEVVSETDPWFEQGASSALFSSRFRNFVVARCRGQGLSLSSDELDLIEAWFAGAPAADRRPAAAPPSAQRPGQQQGAAAPASQPQPSTQPTQAAAPVSGDRWWSNDDARQPLAPDQRADRFGQPTDRDEFPRFVRKGLRG